MPKPGMEAHPVHSVTPKAWFTTTHWSVVLAAGTTDVPEASQALASLCQTYWLPIYSFIRRRGYSTDDAKDLTQGFFARLLAKDLFGKANPDRGRFRTFLLSSLGHFLIDVHDRQTAAKRGGTTPPISLDAHQAETVLARQGIETMTPERLFEQRWALTLLETVLDRLGREFSRTGKPEFFEELKGFVWGDQATTPYPEVAARFGMAESTVRGTVHRLRKRFRELLRLEIAHTVTRPEEIDDEIRYLASVLLQ